MVKLNCCASKRHLRTFNQEDLANIGNHILYMMKLLGHKSINNTLVYTQLVDFKAEEYQSTTANTIEQAQRLIQEGYECVTDINGVKIFRKRK